LVADTPAGFPYRPDVIHAHHTGPAMAAIAAHPGVPALFVCHDATSGFDVLPAHPRLRRIFAVDERCRARLVAEGAEASEVQILPNAVDLLRLPDRAPLPQRPLRAVVLTKHSAHLDVLRSACAAAKITLQEFGFGPGRITDRPEELFAKTDLVFATARTALEASAAGAGVIVCDARGCAGFLTRANAEAWLPYNLGAGILSHSCDMGRVKAAISDWSASEALAASVLIRERCGLEGSLDRLETIYSDMLSDLLPHDEAAEAAAVGNFITGWVPHFGQGAPWRRLADQVANPELYSPETRLTTLTEKGEEFTMTQLQALQLILRRLDVLDSKLPLPNFAIRFEMLMRGLWRRIVPHQIREPLHRARRRALAVLGL
jgi:hypothetical protein